MSGKRLVNAYKNLDKNQAYSLKDAIKIVKENATAKFDETIDLAINLGVDPKHADQMIRGVCQLRTVMVKLFAWPYLPKTLKLMKPKPPELIL